MTAKVGIIVPLIPQSGKEADVAGFIDAGYSIVLESEPETIQWYAIKYENGTFAIFDTFASQAGRQAHLDGQVAAALGANAPKLLVPGSVNIGQVDVLASRVEKGAANNKTAGLSVGIRVIIEAKPEKVETVKNFLRGALALVNQEPETLVWYAIQFPGTDKFAIIDFFANEAGRNAHLGGEVAKALFASVDELLTGTPDVAKVNVVAAKIQD